jgi:hypothetical protein
MSELIEPCPVQDMLATGWSFVDEGDIITITFTRTRTEPLGPETVVVARLSIGRSDFVAAVIKNLPLAMAVVDGATPKQVGVRAN